MHIQNNAWRIQGIMKKMVNPINPFSRFTIGNYESLITIPSENGLDLKVSLHQFFENHYSAEMMSGAIFSSMSIKKMEKLAVRYLIKIPVREGESSYLE
jgi:insulysin